MRTFIALPLLLAGCASPGGALRIETIDAARVPGLEERVQRLLGHHFHLDSFDGPQTIAGAFEHLTTRGHSDLIANEMRSWKAVYGTQLKTTHPREGGSVTVLLWSDTRDFSGGLVYADSENGTYWHAYLAGRAKR